MKGPGKQSSPEIRLALSLVRALISLIIHLQPHSYIKINPPSIYVTPQQLTDFVWNQHTRELTDVRKTDTSTATKT